jgi:hypothetical protein
MSCKKCNGAGWVWWNELDKYDGPALETGQDDQRYSCDACDGAEPETMRVRHKVNLGSRIMHYCDADPRSGDLETTLCGRACRLRQASPGPLLPGYWVCQTCAKKARRLMPAATREGGPQ